MKFYILTDLEGVAGVSRWDQTREVSNVSKLPAMKLLTEEVNAAIKGILKAFPKAEIDVFDGHGPIGMDTTTLHERARLWLGTGAGPWNGLDKTYDAVLFVGQHAMASVEGAPLNHTYSSRHIASFELNGKLIGEFGCRTALAASIGVKTIFLSGDDKAAIEAETFVPGIETVTTKWGTQIQWALHRNPIESRKLIAKGTFNACKRIRKIPLVKIDPPYELIITVYKPEFLEGWKRPGSTQITDTKISYHSKSLGELPI